MEANNSPFATPGNIPCGSKNVSKFVPKLLLPQQMFPRLLAAELSGNNVSAAMVAVALGS